MKIVEGPETCCPLPAEVIDPWDLVSTEGALEHMKKRCDGGYVCAVPITWRSPEPDPIRGIGTGLSIVLPRVPSPPQTVP